MPVDQRKWLSPSTQHVRLCLDTVFSVAHTSPPVQERHWHTGESTAEGHWGDRGLQHLPWEQQLRARSYLLYGQEHSDKEGRENSEQMEKGEEQVLTNAALKTRPRLVFAKKSWVAPEYKFTVNKITMSAFIYIFWKTVSPLTYLKIASALCMGSMNHCLIGDRTESCFCFLLTLCSSLPA